MNKKIIIFAHARSGSNTLMEILNTNSNIKIIAEPFNSNHLKKFYPLFFKKMNVKNKKSLNSYLKLIYKQYNGIKTIIDQMPFELNKELLINPDNKIIFLFRKNLLQTAVSMLIGEKINIWYVNKSLINDYKNKLSKIRLGYMDIEKIKEKINKTKREIKIYKELLHENRIKYFPVCYEELFSPIVSENEKFLKIKQIFEFLGCNQELNANAIKELLNPENQKMTDEKTYLKISNIREIEKKLGNEENGFLFENRPLIKNYFFRLKHLFLKP